MGIFKRSQREDDGRVARAKLADTDGVLGEDGRIESAIDSAMRRGELSEVAGKGKPLSEDYLAADAEFLAHKILKEQGFIPEWARLAQDIDALDESIRAALQSRQHDRASILLGQRNALVRQFNVKVPVPTLQRGLRDLSRYQD